MRRYVVSAGTFRYEGRVGPGGPVTVRVPVCVPASGFVDVAISTVRPSFTMNGGAKVTLHLDKIAVRPDPGACAAAGRS